MCVEGMRALSKLMEPHVPCSPHVLFSMPQGIVKLLGPLSSALPSASQENLHFLFTPQKSQGKPLIPPITSSSTKSALELLLKTFLNSCLTIGNTHPLSYKEKDRFAILNVFLQSEVTAAWG